jgi:hypothetical protein
VSQLHELRSLKLCSKCASQRDPGGGVSLSSEKWICGSCWRISYSLRKYVVSKFETVNTMSAGNCATTLTTKLTTEERFENHED